MEKTETHSQCPFCFLDIRVENIVQHVNSHYEDFEPKTQKPQKISDEELALKLIQEEQNAMSEQLAKKLSGDEKLPLNLLCSETQPNKKETQKTSQIEASDAYKMMDPKQFSEQRRIEEERANHQFLLLENKNNLAFPQAEFCHQQENKASHIIFFDLDNNSSRTLR
eukprot:TRINITY_DN10372_c0_g1_i1.p1 TRINITY_DN10372_c0_g1~~TRINITY_DN10372_c0_g1_i1.p1  ORF type:complete len:167 (-),score=52.66 TRINITY_DN10372_c0_g1_i1:5-505(-)